MVNSVNESEENTLTGISSDIQEQLSMIGCRRVIAPLTLQALEDADHFAVEGLREQVYRLHHNQLVSVVFEFLYIASPGGCVAAYISNAGRCGSSDVLHHAI